MEYIMLSETTTELIKFLDSNISQHVNIPKINPSNKSTKLLTILFYKFAIANNQWNITDIDYNIEDYNGLNPTINIDYYPKPISDIIMCYYISPKYVELPMSHKKCSWCQIL